MELLGARYAGTQVSVTAGRFEYRQNDFIQLLICKISVRISNGDSSS